VKFSKVLSVMNPPTGGLSANLGLLFLRVGVGSLMLVFHGWGKLVNFDARSQTFSDPLGVGSLTSLSLAVFAEVFCAAALIVGFKTRLVAVPLLITMLVAAFIVHANDPWAKQEFALMYALPFLAFMFTGGGRFSVDALLRRRWGRKAVGAPRQVV
jgi:putative oxidoreductase